MRFELMIQPWQGRVLPLYYIRKTWWTVRELNPPGVACKASLYPGRQPKLDGLPYSPNLEYILLRLSSKL